MYSPGLYLSSGSYSVLVGRCYFKLRQQDTLLTTKPVLEYLSILKMIEGKHVNLLVK